MIFLPKQLTVLLTSKELYSMKTCPNCNESNEDLAVECVNCHTKFPAQSSSVMMIIGGLMVVVGLILLIYGNSQNNNIGAQLSSLFGSGKTNPGTPWMIFGGVMLGVGIIMVAAKLFSNKK